MPTVHSRRRQSEDSDRLERIERGILHLVGDAVADVFPELADPEPEVEPDPEPEVKTSKKS